MFLGDTVADKGFAQMAAEKRFKATSESSDNIEIYYKYKFI